MARQAVELTPSTDRIAAADNASSAAIRSALAGLAARGGMPPRTAPVPPEDMPTIRLVRERERTLKATVRPKAQANDNHLLPERNGFREVVRCLVVKRLPRRGLALSDIVGGV